MKRVLLWCLGFMGLVSIAAALLYSRMGATFVTGKIAEATARATGNALLFQEAPRLSLLPPGVKFGQARWGEAGQARGLSLSVKSGVIQVELVPLLLGKLVVSEVRLDNPELDFRSEPMTQTSAAVQESTAGPGPATRPAAASEAGPAPILGLTGAVASSDILPLELVRLVARQGMVRYVDAQGQSLQLNNVNLSVENLRSRQEASVQCDFGLALEPGGMSGNLALHAKLCYMGARLTFRQLALTFTPLDGALPKEAAPAQLTCEGAVDLNTQAVELVSARLSLPQGRASLSGQGGLNPPVFKGGLQVEAMPRKLAALAGLRLKAASEGAKDNLNLKAQVEYSRQAHSHMLALRALTGQTDALAFSGELHLIRNGSPNSSLSLTGSLRAGVLDLDTYWPPAQAPGGQGEKRSAPAEKQAPAWPDLDLRVDLDGLRHGALGVENVALNLAGSRGRYVVEPLSFSLSSGGMVKASLTADLKGKVYALSSRVTGLRLGALLDALGQGRPVDGTAALDANLNGRGADLEAITAKLTGQGVLEVRNVNLAAPLPLSKDLAGFKEAVPRRLDLARAPFTVRDGMVLVQPLTVASPGFNASGQARVDLVRKQLDAKADVKALGLTVPVLAKGPFHNIFWGIDPKFVFSMAKGLPSGLLGPGAGANPHQRQGTGAARQNGPSGAEALIRGLLGL